VGLPRAILVSVGANWVNDYSNTNEASLDYSDDLAEGFYNQMRYHHHIPAFVRGDSDVHEVHFAHPDLSPGGGALNNVDAVNFCWFSGHGSNSAARNRLTIFFDCMERESKSDARTWRFGTRSLKWIVFDTCLAVSNTEANHIVQSWAPPLQGAHLVFGFVGVSSESWFMSGEGSEFADRVGTGYELARSWIDAACNWCTDNLPIAIAAGIDRNDAIDRRNSETTDWRDRAVASTSWLAWEYRETWYTFETGDADHA
jgi:hypothetical protein